MTSRKRKRWDENDYALIEQMLNDGKTLVSIGAHFGKVHSTIIHVIRRRGISVDKDRRRLGRLVSTMNRKTLPQMKPKRKRKYDTIFLEPVNKGKTYREYLAVEERRKQKS